MRAINLRHVDEGAAPRIEHAGVGADVEINLLRPIDLRSADEVVAPKLGARKCCAFMKLAASRMLVRL